MGVLEAIILGLVQGLTEFIPVSSSGHLVLVPWLFGWGEPSLVFDTTLHLGTVVALLAYFWRDFWSIATAWLGGWRSFTWKDPSARLGWYLIVGSLPAVAFGLLFSKQLEALFGEPGFVGGALVVTGCLLAVSERLGRRTVPLERIGLGAAVLVGLAQAIAIMPGISRSGATISAGLGTGLTRPAAARFSFLLGTPIIFGAGMQQLITLARGGGQAGASPTIMAIGFVVAAVSGYLCIRLLLSYLQRGTLYVFAVYCWVVGLAMLALWQFTGGKGLG